ncbi:unnamed protein product [Rotaria sordida]|uniref:Ubiquitin-conjugating enzyme E2 Z n=2 Tax=Rotaria sordida TaxID=392033 RepID=A0A815M7W1_9BILA|nr:unnamed protein product [Rotaria sordida]CAF3824544.1 unnamed protein product [Rotaria sordida]
MSTNGEQHRWNLLNCLDWDKKIPKVAALARIKRDISNLLKDPPPGIFIAPEPDDITKIHALVVGPLDTPYQGGFFYFILRCPPDYPFQPPRCLLMTTGNNTVDFHPSLNRNGKIFLSIINTWDGPSWRPAQSLSSLLVSIQSLLSPNPYHDEPGFEQEHRLGDSKRYNKIISHETLRVAVCEMLENLDSCPGQFRKVMIKQFFKFYDYYIFVCTENMNNDGQLIRDPFGGQRGSFQYSSILTRLKQLKSELEITELPRKEQQPTYSNIENVIESRDG